VLISLRKVENDNIAALKVWSIKNSKLLLECPKIALRLLLPSTQKWFNDTELLKSYLAGGNTIVNFHRQTKWKCHG